MPVQEIKSLTQFNELVKSGKHVVIDFWATWCGPCRIISPIFEKLADLNAANTNIVFAKVDVDKQPDISQEVGIRAMPTFIHFKDNQKIKDVVGADPRALEVLVKAATQ